jgi:glycosyltransferase involved in cell wall biosynthesis
MPLKPSSLRKGLVCTLSKLCLYGTVLNSVGTIEASIRSVFRPDADIVITDGGSTDGTYEKLLEISKDYNLKVYRVPGASRGLGRQLALLKCPEGSYTMNITDLDDEYNVYWHRSIEWGIATGSPRPLPHLYNREYLLSRGGWRDLNYGEDNELWARVGFDYYLPIVHKRPVKIVGMGLIRRDARYFQGTISFMKRTLVNVVSLIRGFGFKPADLIYYYNKWLLMPLFMVYVIASFQGIYRYDKLLNNYEFNLYNMLKKSRDPVKEIKADENYVLFEMPYKMAYRIGVSWIDRRLRAIGLRPYKCRQMNGEEFIAGVRSLNAVEAINDYLRFNLFKAQSCRPLEAAEEY